MYDELFNEALQKKMTQAFLTVLAPLGSKKTFKKNEIVDPEGADQVYIVVDGSFDQVLYSEEGDEISFFRLDKGTIFGEMDFFDGYRTCVITRAAEKATISIVSRDKVEEVLKTQPDLYKEFMHSIIRKYRIVMLELADMRFNNALGKLAHAILRWSHTTNYRNQDDSEKKTIQMKMTHEALASRLASNRSTITNGLKFFKDKGYITIEDRRISVVDEAGLKAYINSYWADC